MAATKVDLPWNPWRVLDEQRARTYAESGALARVEVQMIRVSYRQVPDPEPCPREDCVTASPWGDRPSKAFYRVTVGALMCPTCRSMILGDGRVVLEAAGFTPEWQA